jgi:nicotinate phosphoribosyltransferase
MQGKHTLNINSGLYTDLYELTMTQGYFLTGRVNESAVFDYFFRNNPFEGAFVVFAGLGDLLDVLEGLSFNSEEIEYLRLQGFKNEFLEFLKNFKFSGTIYSANEGEIVFPYTPVLRVEGTIIETQLIETLVLNYLNFESLIATKAARISLVVGDKIFVDFGLRRAQALGGIHSSKAAVIGGANATSNVYAGYKFDLNISGTQAHSWIQSYDDELTAFRKFAELYPDNCILLVDTYDTLNSGIPNAITVAKEMEQNGHYLKGIRIDSGDLAYLSKKTRIMLNESGLEYVKIVASNQLDEYVIQSLVKQGAPIDFFGVGTRLITGSPSAALDGVYKMCMSNNIARLKISENDEKIILPGRKKVIRLLDKEGYFAGDGILLEEEQKTERIFHPHRPEKSTYIADCNWESILHKTMENGQICIRKKSPEQIRQFVKQRLTKLPDEHKRFENPHIYKVGISEKLMMLRNNLMSKVRSNFQSR